MSLISLLNSRSKPFYIIFGFSLTILVGFIDLITGEEIAFSLFYLIPIALVSWYTGSSWGLYFSIASAIVWQLADIASGHLYSTMLISYWNTSIRFSFFIIVVTLLTKLKKSYEHEKMIARTDNLTNAVNRRHFFELLQSEIHRGERNKNPFSVAYLDLDNFKYVNDHFGHDTGDKLLCLLVRVSEAALRKIDVVARLGGDEFAFLLPETSQEGARIAISKLQTSFQSEMQKNGWPVTLSIGVLTCSGDSLTSEELIKNVDELMYTIKNNGKNSISFALCEK